MPNTPITNTQVQIQQEALSEWNDLLRPGYAYELWIFSSRDWIDANGALHGAGSIVDCTLTYRVPGLTLAGRVLTIPSFGIQPTRDAQRGKNTRYSFWIVQVSAAGTGMIAVSPVPGTEDLDGLQVPNPMPSASGCSPTGLCGTFAELIVYNSPSPDLPPDTFYNKDEVNRLVSVTFTGAPASAQYLLTIPNPSLPNAQPLAGLGTGMAKLTAGIFSLAGPSDFEAPLTFSPPLIRTGATVSMPQASGTVAGYLSNADWNTFASKQAALGYTAENVANRNITYAGLTAGKLAQSQMAEVIAIADLTDASGASGSGSTVLKGTFSGLVTGQAAVWSGTDWINATPAGGTVTSVAMTVPSWLAVAGSPLTTSGTLALTGAPGQTANLVLATPDNTPGAVALRALVLRDLSFTVDTPHGGTGLSSVTPFAVFVGGATATSNLNQVAGLGSSGQVLTSAGAGAPPSWQSAPGGAHTFLSSSTPLPGGTPDSSYSAPVRGGLVSAQGTGTALWQQLALGAQYKTLQSNGLDVLYDAVHLDQAAATTGLLPASRGGTGLDCSAAANGELLIGNGTGFTKAPLLAGPGISIAPGPGSVTISAGGTFGSTWDLITSPTTNPLTLLMAALKTTFTWGNATGSGDLFVINDSASNTGTGHVVAINTATGSLAKPIGVFAGGTSIGVEMNAAGVLAAVNGGIIQANALSGVAGNGMVARTAAGTFAARTLTPLAAGGLVITNPDGVSGNPTLSIDLSTLTANQVLWNGSNATQTLTFGVTGTDPVMTFSASSVDVTTGTLKQGGVAVVTQAYTLTAGPGINTLGDLSAPRTISVDQGFSPTWTGIHIWSPAARSGGSAGYFTIAIPVDTGLTASTESIGFRTVTGKRTWAQGPIAVQRENVFAAPSYDASGTPTLFTVAATLAITGAPTAATGNVTFTNRYALWVQADRAQFDGTINGLTLSNTTGTFTLANAKTLTVNNTLTLAGTDGTTLTFQGTDTYVGRATSDTLTNKTLTSSTNVLGGVTMTLGSDATGDLYYRSGGVLTRLPIGSATQVLTVSSGVPAWAAAAGGGTPGGTSPQVEYNNAGAFGGAANFEIRNSNPRLVSSAAPGSPNNGELWYDSTQKNFTYYVEGVKTYGVGLLFVSTANKAVTSTTSETSIIGTGTGTLTLPANFFVVGRTIRIRISGSYSDNSTGGTVGTFKVKLGSTLIASTFGTPTGATDAQANGEPFFLEFYMTCRTTGVSGTIFGQGGISLTDDTGKLTFGACQWFISSTGAPIFPPTVDTTTSKVLDVTVIPNNTGVQVHGSLVVVEILN